MNKILLLVLLHTCTGICNDSLPANKKEERNLFLDINKCVQNIINKLFVLLRLNNKFTADFNNRVLLTMHAFMKTVSENKYNGYSDIKRVAKSLKHNFKNGINEYDNLTSILVQEILTPTSAAIKYSDQINKTGINLPLTSLEIPEQWEESLQFLKEYFKNMEEALNVDAHVKLITNRVKRKMMNVKLRKNLKAWKATNAINNRTDTRRVYKGESANINRYPFIVSIHVAGEFVCAGSIVSKDMILTAATCLHAFLNDENSFQDPKDILIRVGSGYTLRLGNFHRVSHIYFHPKYNVENLRNNLAMLRIDHPLNLKSNKKVRRIAYQRRRGDVPDQIQDVVMLGWGDKGPDISGAFESLSFSRLKIFNLKRCIDIYSRKYISLKNFCAGFKHKGSGACQRDVGGPAIVGNILVGVVSFGPPVCGTPDAPTVFTNIGQYTAWIDGMVKKKPPIVTSTLLPALLQPKQHQKVNHQFIERSGKKTLARKKKPNTVPRSKYPPAIMILQDFIKKLRGGTYLDDMMYEANDNLDEGSDEGIIVDVDDNDMSDDEDNDQHVKQAKNTMLTRNDNEEGVDSLRANEHITNDRSPSINTSEIVKNVVNGLRSEFIKSKLASDSENPFLLAIKSLGNYLGLDFVRLPEQARYRSNQMSEHPDELKNESQNLDKTSSAPTSNLYPTAMGELEIDSLENTFRTKIPTVTSAKSIVDNSSQNKQIKSKNSGNIFSPEESDNYESESQGMSIEVKEVGISPVLRAQTEEIFAQTISGIADGTQTPQEYHDKAQIFLNRNFVKDINASPVNVDERDNKEELVVLLLKTTSQKPEIPNNTSSKVINILDKFKQRVIKASRFSVISDFNTSLQSVDKNNNKSKIEIELPSNVLQTILSNKIPITQLRSVAGDSKDKYSSLMFTIATGTAATADIYKTNLDQINSTIAYNLAPTRFPLLYNHPTSIRSYITPSTATANTSINTRISVVTDSGLDASTRIKMYTNKTNVRDIKVDVSKSTSKRAEFSMAAYEMDEELDDDKYENEDEDDDDILNDTDVLDYINIT